MQGANYFSLIVFFDVHVVTPIHGSMAGLQAFYFGQSDMFA